MGILTSLVGVLVVTLPLALHAEQASLPESELLTDSDASLYRLELSGIQSQVDTVCKLHIYPPNRQVFLGIAGVEKMSDEMLTVLYTMHRQLQNDLSFRHHIGALLELDHDDEHHLVINHEYGGLGLLVDGAFELLPVISGGRHTLLNYTGLPGVRTVRLGFESDDTHHTLPWWAREIVPHVFEFHLHAVWDDNLASCSPSYGVNTDTGQNGGDLAYALWAVEKFGKIHQFMISKLADRRFSIVYFGGVKHEGDESFVAVVALPFWSY